MLLREVMHGQQANPELALSVDATEAVLVFDPFPIEGLVAVQSLLNDGPPATVVRVTHQTQLRRRSVYRSRQPIANLNHLHSSGVAAAGYVSTTQ